ncbi:MAG: sigma-70 family RNA polymerase sigma factor [Pseudonocardia sp.]
MSPRPRPTEAELARLVPPAAAADPAAVDGLMRAVALLVTGFCRKRLAALGNGRADDVVQEVCVGLLKALPRLVERPRPIRPYVFTIAGNKIADAFREAARTSRYPLDETVPPQADRAPGPEDVAVHHDAVDQARQAMTELTEREQQVLDLRVFGELDTAEVAQILEMTDVNVRVTQHRALRKLRAALGAPVEPGD